MVPSRRLPIRPAGALALTLALAGAAAGCGSDDGGGGDTKTAASTAAGGATTATSTAAGGATTSTSGGTTASGGAPAGDEAAIRAALGRTAASTKAARTARISVEQSSAGVSTKATGVVDLVDQRYLLEQTVGEAGGSGKGTAFENYGEKDKVYIRIPGAGGWSVTDNPASTSDPLLQIRLLEKATITKVGGTKEYGGRTCREFDAKLKLADLLGAIDDPSVKGVLSGAPKGAEVPVSSCVDDQGLSYASESSYDLKDILGEAAAQLPSGRSVSKIVVSDYGTAPAPKRPAGIDDAKPLGGASTTTTP